MKQLQSTYFRLSLFYFFFFAALGAFVPYWSLYLKSEGFSAAEIGELMAIVMASKIIAPYFLGWLADHFQNRLIIIQISMLLSVVIFAGVFIEQGYWWLAFIMAVFGFFWNASLPLFEALAFNHLAENANRYSHVRLWGSIGFILLVVSLPMAIDEGGITRLPIILLFLLLLNAAATFFITDKSPLVGSSLVIQKLPELIKTPLVIAFLLACTLQAISHGAYYTFFSIYLEEHEYSHTMIGWMWGLGVIAEVILFVVMYRLLSRFRTCTLFTISLFFTAIRWVILALWVDHIAVLIISQLLHAASFGLFHAAAIHLIHRLFEGRLQARGQALYAGLSFGLGGALGNLISGYTWDTLGSTWTFLGSAVIALLATIISMIYVRQQNMPITIKP